MAQSRLRAVAPDEKPPKRKRLTIIQAAEMGSVREQLAALRERIAKTVQDPNCPPRDLASLSRRMMEITKEIEAIDAHEAEDAAESAATSDENWVAI